MRRAQLATAYDTALVHRTAAHLSGGSYSNVRLQAMPHSQAEDVSNEKARSNIRLLHGSCVGQWSDGTNERQWEYPGHATNGCD